MGKGRRMTNDHSLARITATIEFVPAGTRVSMISKFVPADLQPRSSH